MYITRSNGQLKEVFKLVRRQSVVCTLCIRERIVVPRRVGADIKAKCDFVWVFQVHVERKSGTEVVVSCWRCGEWVVKEGVRLT